MQLQNNIIFETKNRCLTFRFLEWDTNFFGKPSYLVDFSNSSPIQDSSIHLFIKEKFQNAFITAKIGSQLEQFWLDSLQKSGFYYLTTEIKLEKIQHFEYSDSEYVVTELHENLGLPYDELGKTFSKTRFHLDSNIGKEKADALWTSYIKNYKPTGSKRIFAAFSGGTVAGTILVNLDEKEALFFYVAVLDKFRGKDVGSVMINSISKKFLEFNITTGTQVNNIGALNFYIKNGFTRIKNTFTVMHRWT